MIDRLSIICSTYFFDNRTSQNLFIYLSVSNCTSVFITVRDIQRKYTHSSVKSTHFFRFRSKKFFDSHESLTSIYLSARHRILLQQSLEHSFSFQFEIFDENIRVCTSNRRALFCFVQKTSQFVRFRFRFVIMKIFIFAISIDRTTSISFSLKSLFTYEERLASLLISRHYFETRRRSHIKTILVVVDFSKRDDSNLNYTQCIICSLLLYNEYCISESLKKHFRDASYCSLVIQFQQKVESNIAEKKIVEKSKIESFFAFALLVKLLNTYEDRLASLDKWRNVDSKNVLVVVEFSDTDICYKTQCAHCSIEIFDVDREKKSLKYHFRNSFQCFLALQLEKKTSEIIVEIAKFMSVVADIDFFDATLLCDIKKFSLFCEIASFVQQFRQCQHQYRESDLLSLLFECFRDSALIWYKQQQNESEIVKKNLNEWLEVLIIAFSAKTSAKSSIQISFALFVIFSSQYHFCLNCFAFFSSLTRLLQHNQIVCRKVVCKQCEKIFESKNKLHEHIRQHHVKSSKEIINVSKRNFNREKDKISQTISSIISSTTTSKFSIFKSITFSKLPRNASLTSSSTSLETLSKSVTFSELSRNASLTSSSISLEAFTFMFRKSIISSMRWRFSLFTFKRILKRVKIASDCSFISFATSASVFRKSISKSHLTIDDLIRMFREKFKSFDLFQHQNRRSSSQNSDARTFIIYQSRIVVYFLSAVNQKTSISQSLKSSNSKSFQQHTFAKSISLCRSALSEKSIFSSYKKSDFFYISLQSKFSFLQSKFSFARSRSIFSSTSSSFFGSSFSDLHVCCICFDHFSFRNDLFDYRRFSQRYLLHRRPIEEIWER